MKFSTRLTLAMGALVLFNAAVFTLLGYRGVETVVLPRALQHLALHTQLLTADLVSLIRGARADVTAFRTEDGPESITSARLNGSAKTLDGAADAVWRGKLASRLQAEVAAKPDYLQYRILNDSGQEMVRIDRMPDSTARVVPDEELQHKGDMLYFKEAIKLPPGGIYVSKLEFNRERGVIQKPYVPVLRIATSLQTAAGQPFGIVVINLDMRKAFERVRSGARRGAQIFIVNERGEYLVHPDRSREFAFEFHSPDNLAEDFPGLRAAIGGDAPTSEIVKDVDGDRFGAAVVAVRLDRERRLAVIQTLPYSVIMEPATAVYRASQIAAFGVAAVAIILAWLLSRSLTRPLVQMTRAVEAFGRDESATVPLSATGEIGILSKAFTRVTAENRDKTAALKQENAERRRLFETSRDLILVTDRKGRFKRVSPSCAAILGYQPEEMQDRNATDFIDPDDLEHTRKSMRMLRRGHAVGQFETRYAHRDGHRVTLAWTGIWSDPEQQYFFFGRDTTEQMAARDAIKQALVRHQAVFNSAMIGIMMLNESGSIETLNPAAEKIFDVALDSVARRDIGRLIDFGGPSDISSLAQLRRIIASNAGILELVGRRADKTTFPLDFEIADMPIGERRMFVAFVRDISLRKHHERMKDEFVATVSHELRTPMTSIAGSLGLLAGGAAGAIADPAKRLLTIAHGNSQRLVRLINDILDIEKIEADKVGFALQAVELRSLVKQAIEADGSFAEGFGVTVQLDPRSDEAVVRVDPDRMTQVIVNLLSNAAKFSPRGEEVTVFIKNNGATVRLMVRDHGAGIPEDFRDRIFEKFIQVDATDARRKGGTGLGLSIVKQIVLRLGGEVGVYAAPGGGSLFYVDLPCWDHIEFLETERLGQSGDANVLLCEDDRDAAAVLAGRLRAAGFPTDVAYTAQEAVDGATARSYGAILVDLQLPDSDGITLIKTLRAQPQYHNTPIIVVSADPERGRDDRRASTLNVLDWLKKPVDPSQLLRVLDRPIVRDAFVRPRILHVDDDRDVLRLVAHVLGTAADVVSVESIDEARHALDTHAFDLAVLDVALTEGSGLDLLPDLCGADGQAIPVIVFSAQDSAEVAARVLGVLSKSRASVGSLVTTLRRLIAGRVSQAIAAKEVA